MRRKVGRNEACPCGSGLKYKKCCLRLGKQNPYAAGAPSWSMLGNHFTPAAALAIARGMPLGDLDVHPWSVAQIRDRLQLGPGGRAPQYTISRLRAMDTGAILDLLAQEGVDVDLELFEFEAEDDLSAWDLSQRWPVSDEADPELIGLAACELWRRLLPHRPSLEMLDEQMQLGYRALERQDPVTACRLWFEVWGTVLRSFEEGVSLDEVDVMFDIGLRTLRDWMFDFNRDLYPLARREPAVARRARDLYRRLNERFGDPDVRLELAQYHYLLGECAEGEALLLGLIEEYPEDAHAYAVLVDNLSWERHGAYQDMPRAIAVLEQALAAPVRDPEGWGLETLLEELRAMA